jgi:uncharacterized protein (TIGR02996 family)
MARYQFLNDELTLLAAIHECPHDDTVRLVYADWLQEHDQPDYAEFMRWQLGNPLELKIPRPSTKTLALWRDQPATSLDERMRQRLALNFGLWGRPFPGEADVDVFYRGLPLAKLKWVLIEHTHYDRLQKANPRLRFQFGLDDTTLGFLSHPIFARADAISLYPSVHDAPLTTENIRTLAEWPGIHRVRSVTLRRVAETEHIRALFPPALVVNLS